MEQLYILKLTGARTAWGWLVLTVARVQNDLSGYKVFASFIGGSMGREHILAAIRVVPLKGR